MKRAKQYRINHKFDALITEIRNEYGFSLREINNQLMERGYGQITQTTLYARIKGDSPIDTNLLNHLYEIFEKDERLSFLENFGDKENDRWEEYVQKPTKKIKQKIRKSKKYILEPFYRRIEGIYKNLDYQNQSKLMITLDGMINQIEKDYRVEK